MGSGLMKNRYLIIGYSRSGTTVIHLLLKGHPNVAALNDELRVSPFFTEGISAFTYGHDLAEEKERGYSVLLDGLTSLCANENTMAFGAKCTCDRESNARSLVDTLQQHLPDLKIILMVRNDLVAQYGSLRSAERSGIWHSWYEGFKNRKIHTLKIKRWLFIRYVVSCLDTYQVLRELHQTHDVIECVYEEFLVSQESVYEKLCNFLGIPQIEAMWLDSKKVMPPPEEYITNYDEMTSLLEKLRTDHARGDISPLTVRVSEFVTRVDFTWFRLRRRVIRE